jgi:hypothetical protein
MFEEIMHGGSEEDDVPLIDRLFRFRNTSLMERYPLQTFAE